MSSKTRLFLILAGLVVLLAGYTGAALVWRAQNRAEQQGQNESGPLPLLDSRRDAQQVELNFGRTGLVVEHFREWFLSLFHGRRLAETLVVLSSGAAIGCFFVAGRRTG